ncbi:ExbD/TolR family protein [Myxococcus qinghaiensis]|uniref:ExbD/TolR family protein n=1 Tax=Myxococcus qinghaiensis TaxID=2906758 RepID=UPI0020A7CA11|nr:biopolymer transporter ExbD [Myxococcus qinghaiensis]MCP3163094.1 biopolymer transporter ExbD [Myxococcus qinghaiensis]
MAGHKQRQWVKPQTPPNSEINVTPLVDVVLVLLIIFMVVTPLLEKDILVRVPDTEVENEPPPENNDQQLVVLLDKDGGYSINTEKVPTSDYVPRLKRMLAAKKADEKVVFFMADDATNYGRLILAMDGAKGAGAKVLAMATELPSNAIIQGTQVDTGTPAPAPTPTP